MEFLLLFFGIIIGYVLASGKKKAAGPNVWHDEEEERETVYDRDWKISKRKGKAR